MYGDRVARWDRAVEWPLTIAAVVFLVAYATQILARERGSASAVAEAVVWVTWGIFAIDYIVRLVITENRRRWFIHHLLDLAIVILPMLRPLRLMRFLTILAIIQRGAGSMVRGRVIVYTIGATLLTIFVAGLAVLDAEQGNHGPIQNLGDALWWAFVTITTVGYGDYFPVTFEGRMVAVGLMIGGIALIGIVTATLASWIVEKVSAEAKTAAATQQQVEDLRTEVAELKDLLRESLTSKQTRESDIA
ncbi:ion transporter [Microbacterium mangrovi]|uniref:Ion transporter n=1 Tax=Microbacterium mangrovi TaxID=1348253 RepID=A0A0B2A5T5_9MICO|nr:potassium channel family protein [Microbacterium mangrovi]KHK98844.1 ion transporter [Microbacterium mangrovi]